MESRNYIVQFHGSLAEEFGGEERYVNARNLQDVFNGLISACGRTFKKAILDGKWHIITGEKKEEELLPTDNYLAEKLVAFPIQEERLHIFPAVIGAGGKSGIGEMILGVVLIVVAVVLWNPELVGLSGTLVGTEGAAAGSAEAGLITAATASSIANSLALAGAMSILGGVMALITPVPKMNYGVAQRQSFIFNAPINNTNQGVALPVVYGECMTGSTVISADIQTSNVNWNMLTAQQVADGVQH